MHRDAVATTNDWKNCKRISRDRLTFVVQLLFIEIRVDKNIDHNNNNNKHVGVIEEWKTEDWRFCFDLIDMDWTDFLLWFATPRQWIVEWSCTAKIFWIKSSFITFIKACRISQPDFSPSSSLCFVMVVYFPRTAQGKGLLKCPYVWVNICHVTPATPLSLKQF